MFNSSPPQPVTPPPVGETSRIKSFMGRTPAIGILKSKFLTVLGNSNELLNGISSKVSVLLLLLLLLQYTMTYVFRFASSCFGSFSHFI